MTVPCEPSNALLSLSVVGGTLTVAGEIDASNADALRRSIEGLPVGDRTIVMESVSFVDCAGLSTLVAATIDSRRTGDRFVLSRPSRAVERIMELTNTTEFLTIAR